MTGPGGEREEPPPGRGAKVVVNGLSLYTHHGVTDEERRVGQRLVLDATLELADAPARWTDDLEDTIDYAAVCDELSAVAAGESYRTLERLASVACERLAERFHAARVTVRATKPEPPIELSTEGVAVEVSLPDGGSEPAAGGG